MERPKFSPLPFLQNLSSFQLVERKLVELLPVLSFPNYFVISQRSIESWFLNNVCTSSRSLERKISKGRAIFLLKQTVQLSSNIDAALRVPDTDADISFHPQNCLISRRLKVEKQDEGGRLKGSGAAECLPSNARPETGCHPFPAAPLIFQTLIDIM